MADDFQELARFRTTHPSAHHLAGGLEWEYIASGIGGETLLLLPGALGRAETAFHYVLAFEDRYRVIACTYPAAADSVERVVNGLASLLDAQHVARAHVVGGSFSGLVGQYMVAAYPERVASLILANSGAPFSHRHWHFTWISRILALLPQRALYAVMQRSVRLFLARETAEHEFWRAYFAEIIPTFTKAELLGRARLMAAMTAPTQVAQWAQSHYAGPVLIVDAVDDRIFGASQRAALRNKYPQARQVVLAAQGHSATLDRTTAYIASFEAFLQGITSPSVE
ncbi:MAG: alpha/beta hydrolase [Caldilineaceae bacterium]|nr:alpha/beta hydrolase [Caldilineaceae bacterium]